MFKNTTDKLFSEFPQLQDSGNALLAKARGDKFIWGIVILLSLVSILVVYSATGGLAYRKYNGNTEFFLFKQVAFSCVGIIAIYFLHQINYTIFLKISTYLVILSVPLLIYTLFFTESIQDEHRWIMIPIIKQKFQTSDFAKFSLFVYLAKMLSKKQEIIKDFKKSFLPTITPVIIICGLIAPANLSTAVLVGASALILMFIGRMSMKHILFTILIAAIPLAILMMAVVVNHKTNQAKADKQTTIEKLKSTGRVGTWISRIDNFLYPKASNTLTQREQANMAIANGSILFGVGPGNSTARNYLSEAENDFIYAILIEEYGLLGGAFILFIYIVFLYRCIRIYKKTPYAFGAFLALGLSFTLVIQALANMAVSVGLVPVTGVTLPLISLGGTSYLITCASIGIILSVGRNVEQLEGKPSLQKVEPPIQPIIQSSTT
jgi:cell division protein FtsW